MKRAVISLTLGLLLAMAGYIGVYRATTAQARAALCAAAPELAWLKQEFNLDDAQFARVSALHAAYVAQSLERCRTIRTRSAALRTRIANAGQVTPDIETDMNALAQLRADCQKEMFRHFLTISRSMPPEQGRRYLDWVLEQSACCHSASSNVACPATLTQ